MSETVPNPITPDRRVPGPVIFVAIMNFISTSFLGIVSLICLAGLIFGNIMGLYDFVSHQMTSYSAAPNFSYGVTFILGLIFAVSFGFVMFFVLLGIGLLKAKRMAWYVQVALCVIGLFAFPLGTALNTLILFLFFRQPVRVFFKV